MDLYHNNMSVCAQKVRLVLAEKQLRPVEHHLNLRAGDATTPEYLRINPNGVIPTLIDRGSVILESTVICEYLDDAYPQAPLRPEHPIERAQMRIWTLLPDSGLHRACGVVSFAIAFRHQMLAQPPAEVERQLAEKPDPRVRAHLRATIDHGLDAPVATEALQDYNRVLTRISRQLTVAPWLAGERYTLADVALLPYVARLQDLSLSWLWDGERAAIGDWLSRCQARANYSGISAYRDDHYVQLLARSGAGLREQIQQRLENA